MSSMRQQQWSAKNIFCKQKSIDDKTVESSDSQGGIGRRVLRKQLSVDHVTPSLKHASKVGAPVNLSNLAWQNSTNEPNLRIVTSSAIKKRAQFAASANNSINKQELFKTMMKSAASASETTAATKARDKININIFLSQDVQDDVGCSDNETTTPAHKQSATSSSNVALKSSVSGSNNSSSETTSATNGKQLSASARRAQFQSRRIMSAPIRPLTDDSKGKRRPRKKKVIRDKDIDESPDEYAEELEELKQPLQTSVNNSKSSTKKNPPMRSRSIMGCDQMGIETLVSMLNSGESDSEKEDIQQAPPMPPPLPAVKNDATRIRANMLRKTVSFQEDDVQLQSTATKDPFTFRRNSVVPFAGRMRNTRSLFGQEICNLYMNNTGNSTSNTIAAINNAVNNNNNLNGAATNSETDKNENDLNSSNQPQEEVTKEKPRAKKQQSDEAAEEKKSQESVAAPRELECWRLYEKMKKTGLNISYDTILRGILKPSELRLLEKQKKLLGDIEERAIDDCDEVKHDE